MPDFRWRVVNKEYFVTRPLDRIDVLNFNLVDAERYRPVGKSIATTKRWAGKNAGKLVILYNNYKYVGVCLG